ncbi:hypothetical protein C2G38_2218573 [Gigaspora rosea]|uniref:Uncharacterized protein n=1 Tax=Gigaspora rosea TaxID=44941 RepID=A0A397UFD1_9GLOM|nr:hypothetical protein C2G38_2218573 [Gigaspora rosea]
MIDSIRDLRQKEVYNIQYKVHEPQNSYFKGNESMELDNKELINFLQNKKIEKEEDAGKKSAFVETLNLH